ncbi:hypothetical protein A6J66_004615 [Yersinia enterocolitica]|nr:hypothetical protein A6J66_004615 [Yersinia enterocolitica]
MYGIDIIVIVEQFELDNFVGDHYHRLAVVLIDYSLGIILSVTADCGDTSSLLALGRSCQERIVLPF